MRNTIKFLHPMHFAIIVLCGYGVEGMIRLARQETEGSATLIKKWVMGFAIAAGACLLFSLVMGASKGLLAQHIAGRGFTPETAATMAAFSSWELIITALIFGIGVFLIYATGGAYWLIFLLACLGPLIGLSQFHKLKLGDEYGEEVGGALH